MTSTSSRKFFLFIMVSFSFTFLASGSHYYNDYGSSGDYSSGNLPEGFSVPEYDSKGELLTELIAPFLAIAVVLQFAFYKILGFTLAVDDDHPFGNRRKQKARARKQSLVLSLVVTAMLVPSPFWSLIRKALQGLAIVSVLGLFLAVLFVFYYMLGLDEGDGGDDD